MFTDATAEQTRRLARAACHPRGRHPSQCVGKGSTEGFLRKVGYAETWIHENTQPDQPQPPAWPISGRKQLRSSLPASGSAVPVGHPGVVGPESCWSL